jgi:hypothetical protein
VIDGATTGTGTEEQSVASLSRIGARNRRPTRELSELLRAMRPVLNEGVYVYTVVAPELITPELDYIARFKEREGVTLVLAEAEAIRAGLSIVLRVAWITLDVHSDLQAVGFTAAFSRVLANAGIGCNVMGAAHHDHIFVPWDQAEPALACLERLQRRHNDPAADR